MKHDNHNIRVFPNMLHFFNKIYIKIILASDNLEYLYEL